MVWGRVILRAMRKWVIIGGPVVLVFVLTLIFWRPRESAPPDPVYNGRPLSTWLNDPMLERKDAIEAVRGVGTKAIPMLLRLVEVRDAVEAPWMTHAADPEKRFMPVSDVMRWQMGAELGFETLGTNAQNAVPALMRVLSKNDSKGAKAAAIICLGSIGRPAAAAVALLVEYSTNAEELVRLVAVESLCKIHGDPEKVVPVLIRSLGERNKNMESTVLQGLDYYGSAAQAAAPAIIEYLKARRWDWNDDKEYLQSFAEWALKAVDPGAAVRAGITNVP